ncbi:hypothetical protein [Streptomyces sp. 1222.5]|uniref:hypothetical protein n=1 Tax=Streptomyces sp. 1222.5 TaxID=1881026 RepID=UPI003D723C9A
MTVGHNGINAVHNNRAVWIDGDPLMEAIAAAVWEQCGRSDSGTYVEDDPRNIAVAAYAAVQLAGEAHNTGTPQQDDRPFRDEPTEVLRHALALASVHASQAARFRPQDQDDALPAVADLFQAELQHREGQPPADKAEELVHVGWWCWRGDNHGHLATMACRSDNVPIHVPAEWADEMRAVLQRIEDGDEGDT